MCFNYCLLVECDRANFARPLKLSVYVCCWPPAPCTGLAAGHFACCLSVLCIVDGEGMTRSPPVPTLRYSAPVIFLLRATTLTRVGENRRFWANFGRKWALRQVVRFLAVWRYCYLFHGI